MFVLVHTSLIPVEEPRFVTDCELSWVKIQLKGHKELLIGSFYMPKRNRHSLSQLELSLEKINAGKTRNIILCGDFNCPHINWETYTASGTNDIDIHQFLIDISLKFGLTQLIRQPTRQGNILDLVFTSNPSLIKSTTVIPGLSDHDIPLIDSLTRPKYNKCKKRQVLLYSKANWDDLQRACTEISENIQDLSRKGHDIKSLWNHFKTSLLSEISSKIPSKTIRTKNDLPWFGKDLKRMLRKKLKLFNQAKKSGDWTNYKTYQKDCKKAFRKAETEYINNTINEGLKEDNTKPFWKYIKAKRQDNIGVSPLTNAGTLHVDSKSKAEILLNQFSSVFTKPTPAPMPALSSRSDCSIDSITVDSNGVSKLLSNLKVHKASGPDQIPNQVLKHCAEQLAPGVATLFQNSLDTSTLPDDWTSANISPIYKKGDRHAPENYRPVSLTCVLSKILEHIVCSNMLRHLEENNILTHLNHGFRSGFSCESQLTITVNDLCNFYDNNCQTDIAILDFSKAFDTVPHDRLLHKLESYGIRGSLHSWIKSFLTLRSMKVVIDGEASSEAKVISGVPQGTVLGPLLFLCHINDLPERVTSLVRLFADDCLLYRTIRNTADSIALQEDLKNLEKWAADWGMKFNASKCYILSIRKKSSYFYQLNNTILQEVSQSPYLGITLSKDLKWSIHIDKICKRASSTLGILRRNMQHCPLSTRHTAYTSLIRSTLEYASSVWDPYFQSDIQKLERMQRQSARFIKQDYKTRLPGTMTNMLQDLELLPLQERRKNIRLQLLYKIINGLVPAIPPEDYLKPVQNKRRIRPTTFDGFNSKNFVKNYQINHTQGLTVPSAKTDIYKNSFFIRTIKDWNLLEEETVTATSLENFKTRLLTRM